jgi:hypothetical protein
MDRVWVGEVILRPRGKDGLPEPGTSALAGGNGHAAAGGWREDVKQAARAQGKSAREAEDLVRQFEERRRTMKERAAKMLAAAEARSKENGRAGNPP